jgi:hypothetical protein
VKRRLILGLIGGLALGLPGAASAAQVIGQVPSSPPAGCPDDNSWVQAELAEGTSYTASSYGVITSWSAFARATPNETMKLMLVEQTGVNEYRAVRKDIVRALTTPDALNTFTGLRLPIEANQSLAIFQPDQAGSDGPCAFLTSFQADTMGFFSGEAPDGVTVGYSSSFFPYRLNAQAVVEPDTDRDVFGDETQDKCVGRAGTFNGCPSTVTVDSAKQKGKKPRIKVTTTVPGAGTLQAGAANDASLASASGATSLKPVSQTITATSEKQLTLTLKLTKATKKQLASKGKLKTQVKVVYTPIGGPPSSQTRKVKLKS